MKKAVISILLLFALMVAVTGCAAVSAADLMDGIEANAVTGTVDLTNSSGAVTDFSVRLFQRSMKAGENTLISPLSVLCALSMTANGAKGETLSQMEEVLGLPVDTLNTWFYTYMKNLPETKKCKLSLANSIWFKDDPAFTVARDFLQTNADYYNAGVYKAPFDHTTLKDINNWVEDRTDGMIQDILDRIPEETVMYLVNTLAFEAEWQTVYRESQIRGGTFVTEDGLTRDVQMMHSEETLYLEDDSAVGFIKYYSDKKYAFAALLPEEGISVDTYVSSLTGSHLNEMLSDPQRVAVYAAIPKFETEYDMEMSQALADMGMADAFNGLTADFSGLGSTARGNIFINRVLHKTFIKVDEKGTKAGAATAVEMNAESGAPSDAKTVTLDRPFVYMLIDCETNLPFFIGTMMDPTQR